MSPRIQQECALTMVNRGSRLDDGKEDDSGHTKNASLEVAGRPYTRATVQLSNSDRLRREICRRSLIFSPLFHSVALTKLRQLVGRSPACVGGKLR